jgi:hypothetical protein
MLHERRDTLRSALMLALLTATPASIFAATKRMRDGSERFLWLELADRDFLSLDLAHDDRVRLVTTAKLADGTYTLRGGRSFAVRDGRVSGSGGPIIGTHPNRRS